MEGRVDVGEHRARVLAACGVFRGLDPADLAEIAARSRLRSRDAGARIFERGERGDTLFIVESGLVQLSTRSIDGERMIAVALAGAGEIFGEIESSEATPRDPDRPRLLDADVLETAAILSVDGRDLRQLMERRPEVSARLRELLGARVRRLVALIEDVSFRSVEIRLARHVLELADRLGMADGAKVVLRRRLTHQQLADALGVTRRSVLNTLQLWEEAGIVHHDRDGVLSVLDGRRLVELAALEIAQGRGVEVEPYLEEIDRRLDAGQPMQALYRAIEMTRRFPATEAFGHRAALAALRAGARTLAGEIVKRFGFGPDHPVEDIAVLPGRIAKEAVWGLPPREAAAAARRAAELYSRVWQSTGGTYAGINAASLWHVAGEMARARATASVVGEAAARGPAGYWRLATMAEAALLLDRPAEAASLLARAAGMPDATAGAVASTRRQLRRLAATLPAAAAAAAALPQGRVAHFAGHMAPAAGVAAGSPVAFRQAADAIARALETRDVRWGCGALASGADILFAEALLERGAELTVVLPFRSADFLRRSVQPAGAGWVDRYTRCLEQADRVVVVVEGPPVGGDVDFLQGDRVAMGTALLRAEELEAEAEQLVLWDGRPGQPGFAGTASAVSVWSGTGRQTTALDCPWRPRGAAPAVPAPAPPAEAIWRAVLIAWGDQAATASGLRRAPDGEGSYGIFDRPADAVARARELAGAGWSVAGDLERRPLVEPPAGAAPRLLRRRPLTAAGEAFATLPLAAEGAIVAPGLVRFDPVGRVEAADKSLPRPMYALHPPERTV